MSISPSTEHCHSVLQFPLNPLELQNTSGKNWNWPNSLECFLPQKDRIGPKLWNFCRAAVRVPTTQPKHIIKHDARSHAELQITVTPPPRIHLHAAPCSSSLPFTHTHPYFQILLENSYKIMVPVLFSIPRISLFPANSLSCRRLKHNLVHWTCFLKQLRNFI